MASSFAGEAKLFHVFRFQLWIVAPFVTIPLRNLLSIMENDEQRVVFVAAFPQHLFVGFEVLHLAIARVEIKPVSPLLSSDVNRRVHGAIIVLVNAER